MKKILLALLFLSTPASAEIIQYSPNLAGQITAIPVPVNQGGTGSTTGSSTGLILGTTATQTGPHVSGDVRTGLYSDTASTIEFSAGGVKQATINTSGLSLTNPLGVPSGGTGLTAPYYSGTNLFCPIFAYGDSLTSGTGSTTNGGYVTQLQTASGCNVYNLGIGGQVSTQIAERSGALGFTLSVTSSQLSVGANTVTALNGAAPTGCNTSCATLPLSTPAYNGGTAVLWGSLCGYHGYLSRASAGGPPSTSETYSFTPDFTSGGPFACADNSSFVADNSSYTSYPQLIWSGRNDAGISTATVISNVATMVAALMTTNYGVLSVINAETEPSGSLVYNRIATVNASFSSSYSANYLDVRSWLVNNYSPSNAADVVDNSKDVPPYTLHRSQASGTLGSSIDNATCSIPLTTTVGGLGTGVLALDSEYIMVNSATSGGVTTCTRAYAGSAASHTVGAVFNQADPIHLNQAGYNLVSQYAWQKAPWLGASFSTAGYSHTFLPFNPPSDVNGQSFAIGNGALGNQLAQPNVALPNAGYQRNTAVGYRALYTANNSSAFWDTAIGANALSLNNGPDNTAVGANAGYVVSTGGYNTFVGANVGQSLTTGTRNSFLGYNAGFSTSTTSNNTCLGDESCQSALLGGSTIVGASAGWNTTGANNTIIGGSGYQKGVSSGANNTIIGYFVGGNVLRTGSNNILLGTSALVDTTSSNSSNTLNIQNAIFGTGLTGSTSTPAGSIGILNSSPGFTLDVNGTGNFSSALATAGLTGTTATLTGVATAASVNTTATGATVPYQTNGYNMFWQDVTNHEVVVGSTNAPATIEGAVGIPADDTAIGYHALNAAATGANNNTAVGSNALATITTAGGNTAVGTGSLQNSNSVFNVGVGDNALLSDTTGQTNVAVGHFAHAYLTSGSLNVSGGYNAARYNNGSNNVAIGAVALAGATTTAGAPNTGGNNTAVGYSAGTAITTGAGNTILGYNAGNTLTTGQGNLLLGYAMQATATTTNYEGHLGYNGNDAIKMTAMNTATPPVTIPGSLNAQTTIGMGSSNVLLISSTAPTISSGFCSSPTIPNNNGTAAFTINVGTGCAGSTGTLTMPAATTGWACIFQDVTTPASYVISQTGGATNTVTLTSYARTTGLASNFTASDIIRASCHAY